MRDNRIDPASSRLALVMNGAAGRKDAADKADQIRARLAPAFRDFRLYEATRGHDIAEAARRALEGGADVVAALGGDGTQSAVAGVLAGTGKAHAILPGGTFNYFAREFGVGDSLDQALDAILGGQTRALDLGEVNGRIFLNNASFGIYPEILEQRESIYRRWGRSRIAAYWSVLVTLMQLRHPMRMTITAHGETRHLRTALAFAARSAYQLETLGLDGADAVRDGHFALFLAKGHKRHQLIGAALRLAMGRVARGQDFELVVADEIHIDTSTRQRLLAFDGEKARMRAPFHLKVRPADLRIIVPGTDGAGSDAGTAPA